MIRIDGLSFSYGKIGVFNDICFDVEAGEIIAVLGNNGAGKSTMIKCLNKILPADRGNVFLDGKSVMKMKQRAVARRIAYVPQTFDKSPVTVYDTVLMGRKPYIRVSATDEDFAVVDGIIEKLGLGAIKLKQLNEISGGEAQLVILGRALAQQPRILLLDEPTSSLDLRNQIEVMKVVREVSKENNISVIIVMHDINSALCHCNKFLFLKNSGILSYGGPETVTRERIEEVYGVKTDMIYHEGKKYFIAQDVI